MDEDIYVQAIGIKMVLPNGEEVFGKFMGMALCSPEQWEKLKKNNKSLVEALAEGKSLLFKDPIPLEEAITNSDEYEDIVDMVRDELQREHHNDLTE